jgi:hypothetical protein
MVIDGGHVICVKNIYACAQLSIIGEGSVMEEFVNNKFLKEAFQELSESSTIYLAVNGETYKLVKRNNEMTLMPPAEDDKPLLIFESTKKAIDSIICADNPKETLQNLYLKSNFKVKWVAPTGILSAYRVPFMLRKIGLTQNKT